MKYSLFLPLLALAGCAAAPDQAASTDDACKVALRYIELARATSTSKLPLLVIASDAQPLDAKTVEALGKGFKSDPVPLAMLRQLNANKGGNAFTACPQLSAELTQRGIANERDGKKYDLGDRDADGTGYKWELIGVSRPVLSADGSEALVEASSIVGPEAGVGQVHHLRDRPLLGWKITASEGTWIS